MRALFNKKIGEEVILRRSLLKTRCKMAGKCCKVIVDSGNLENLALEDLVTKLQLKILKNPKFYHVHGSWMNKISW